MGGSTTRKSYTKIKNFTEKDQVRIKYSHIGKDKKLMLSVYIGEDVYNELTNGMNFKRLKVEYIPNDMVIITPTNEEKEGIVHRYNGKGMFKTTCVRLSLSSYKTLKIRKKDFNNRVVEYTINNHRLNIDLIGDKRKKITPTDPIKVHKEFAHRPFIESIKPIEISAPDYQDMPSREYIDGPTPMYVSHDFLNDIRDTIENRLLGIEERFEKRIQEIESLLKEFMDQPLRPLKADKGNINPIDIVKDSINAMGKEIVELNTKLFNIESKINVLLQKAEFKNCHENKSLMEKIFGKD